MRLLIDQNLSPKLAGSFRNKFSDTVHLQDLGLDVAEDLETMIAKHIEGIIAFINDSENGN